MSPDGTERGDALAAPPDERPVFRIPDAVSGALFLLGGAAILLEVADYPPRPMGGYGSAFFPQIIAGAMLLVGAAMLVSGLRARRAPAPAVPARAHGLRPYLSAGLLLALALFSVFAVEPLGFVPTGVLVAFLFMVERRGRPLSSLFWSVVAVAVIYALFTRIFGVVLPTGIMPLVLS